MRRILGWILVFFIMTYQIKAEGNDGTENPDKLDKNFRKALLRALNDLESDNNSEKVASGAQEVRSNSFPITTLEKSNSLGLGLQETSAIVTNVPSTTYKAPSPISVTMNPSVTSSVSSTTEESEAKVEDLQFFAAPLVAAFTVHQDELGIPKSVEPIFKAPGQKTATTKDLEEQQLKELEAIQKKQEEEKRKEEELKLQEYRRKQEELSLKYQIEEKRKFLEQQLRTLQERQKQQDIYLRQQQILHEQQRQKLLEEQRLFLKSGNFNKPEITVQPAILYHPPPEAYADNSLQLPTKNYQSFSKARHSYQQLALPNPVNFQSSYVNTPTTSPPNYKANIHQSNRVFRHESGTGNFANGDINNYRTNEAPQNNRFFRSSPQSYSITPSITQDYYSTRYVRAPYVNNQLNNLLYYSGISQGKQQEDLNIISKVLAFNLRGDNYYGGSELSQQQLTPPRKYVYQY
ncbi:hypothetical protein FQA39_LY09113 [Lamprigera yunnana]|nr:hypothetical protein FQA39_LY09113 [Lamprigera yunnana]